MEQAKFLFEMSPPIATKEQKEIMYQLCKKPQYSNIERREVWMLSSGALNAMMSAHESQTYWKIIDNYNRAFPNPNDH